MLPCAERQLDRRPSRSLLASPGELEAPGEHRVDDDPIAFEIQVEELARARDPNDALAREGLAVLLISSELEEVLGLAHRVLVMREGTIVREFDAEAASQEAVMEAAFGEVGTEVAA